MIAFSSLNLDINNLMSNATCKPYKNAMTTTIAT